MSENVEREPEPVRKQRNTRKILIICGVIVVNLGLLVLIVSQLLTPASHVNADPLIGHTAPDFSLNMLTTQSGQQVISLAAYRGKAIVINFWASWCSPCKEEVPLLEDSWEQMQAQQKDIVFLGIDFEEANSQGLSFLKLYNITYPAVEDIHGVAANKYAIVSLPDTIFIGRDGIVKSNVAQQLTAQLLKNGLQTII